MTKTAPSETRAEADGAGIAARRAVMALCAEATGAELDAALAVLAPLPAITDLRPPERGLVMVRGRMGGEGRPFNLGEASVVRAAIRTAEGAEGHAYQLGRDIGRARAAAIVDALWQSPDRRAAVAAAMAPVRERLEREAATLARQTAATRVDFFTMVRGE